MPITYPRFQVSGAFAYSLYVNSAGADGAARSSRDIVQRTTLNPTAMDCSDDDPQALHPTPIPAGSKGCAVAVSRAEIDAVSHRPGQCSRIGIYGMSVSDGSRFTRA